MSIPLAIDTIVKSYGIPVGDKAKREWQRFRESDWSWLMILDVWRIIVQG